MNESEVANILHSQALARSPLTANCIYDIDDLSDPKVVNALELGAPWLKAKSEPDEKRGKVHLKPNQQAQFN